MKTLFTAFVCLAAMIAQAQRTYSPLADPDDNNRLVIDEFFPADNRNGWSIGQSEFTRTYLDFNGGYFSLSNTKQDQSYVVLLPKWQHNLESDFVIKVNFSLLKPLIKKPVGGVSGAGFAWGGNAPYQNMQVLYFRYDKPLAEYTVWNEKGEAKLILEKAVPQNSRKEYSIEIQRKGNAIYFYEASKDDCLTLLFSAPFQSFQGQSNIGFYVSGELSIAAKKLLIKEAMTAQEIAWATQQRAEDFRLWNATAEAKAKELQKFDGKDYAKLKQKDREKLSDICQDLAKSYFEMGNIKRLDKDPEATVVFYTMATDLAQQYKVPYFDRISEFYLGRAFEEKYKKYGAEIDKTLALSHYLKAAKKDRADLGFPGTLKAYYQLKYPFITDYTYISPYWQNENMLPKTKEAYKKYEEDRVAYAKKSKELAEKFARRPFILIKSVVIDNYASDPAKSYVTTTSTQYPKVILQKIPFEELKYGDYYYDISERDFIPFTMSYDKVPKMKNRFVMVIRFDDYNVNFNFTEYPGCAVCFGEGFVKTSSGAYTYRIATGRYTETRSGTIVGQTEAVTRTPVYETHTIQAGPPKYEICKTCNGTGGIKREKNIQIIVDGKHIK
ncbi:MAG: hypothetical protein ACK5MK_09280 [Dysgonomonas sp.]